MTRSSKIEEQITADEARLETFRSELEDLKERDEQLREESGVQLAEGAPAGARQKLRDRIRAVGDEIDERERAIPVVEARLAKAKKELKEALGSEAERAADQSVERVLEELKSVADGLDAFLSEWVPQVDSLEESMRTAWAAERRVAQVKETRLPLTSRVVLEGWQRRPGLQELVEAARAYRAGGPRAYAEQQQIRRKAAAQAEREEREERRKQSIAQAERLGIRYRGAE